MRFNVIGYLNEVLGEVEASDTVEAWSKAGEKFNNILDVREVTPVAPGVAGQRFTPETMGLMEDSFRTVENGAQIGDVIDEWTRREPGSIMKVVKLTRGNFEYLDDLHRILRQQYGDKIIVWRGGKIREGVISVTTNRATAVMFSERLGAGEEVHQFSVNTDKVLAASPTMESELIVYVSDLKP